MSDPYRALPQVEKTLEDPRVAAWCGVLARPLVSRIVSELFSKARREIADSGVAPDPEELIARIEAECGRLASRRIRKVINATGIILHTNMGRAPLSPGLWEAAGEANTGYSNLELDLGSGKRGRRDGLCPELLSALTGCEDALVVNNNAAALLLILSVLAKGREVIVSRGEQVQIGGGFRVPEILALSGARLVEVGTTNITTLGDYLGAIGPETAMVLAVHPSNFRIRGFTEKPDLALLAGRLPEGLILAVDQGSGVTTEKLPGEIGVGAYLKQGADLVCFSADKVLGGPQAGIIVGRGDLVAALRDHPLLRAFRPGKAVYSLLEEHLLRRLRGSEQGPVGRLLSLSPEELTAMGRRLLADLPEDRARLRAWDIATGGGSAPDETFPSLAIELISERNPRDLLRELRELPLPIIGVIEGDRVILSLATMYGEDEGHIARSIASVMGAKAPPCT